MKKITQRIKKVRKMLENKKQRNIVIFSMYSLFVVLVMIAILLGASPSYKLSKALEDFKSLNNYSYSYNINSKIGNEIKNKTVAGKRFNDKRQLVYGKTVYNFESGKLVGFPVEEINLSKLEFDDIYELIYMSKKLKKDRVALTEGLARDDYELSLSRFVKYVNDLDIKSDKVIKISVIHKDKELVQIDFYLKEYVNLNENIYDRYTVTLSYNNIGNVVDF